jgi:bifunctional DNase/RNase
MIEVRVGSIERHPVTGAPLVALEPRDTTARTRLVLPLSTAVACSLSHELEGQTTLRGMVYTLLGQIADILGGEITAVEIVPAANDMAAGRLRVDRVDGDDGAILLPVEIPLGIGLAVVLGLPLRVADKLVHDAPKLDRPATVDLSARADGQPDAPPSPEPRRDVDVPTALDVPDAFRRAFSS